MSPSDRHVPRDLTVLIDVGSTFTKAVCVDQAGRVVSAAQAPTRPDDLRSGFEKAAQALGVTDRRPDDAGADSGGHLDRGYTCAATLACSSAAGGLRLFVIGMEPSLTVRAGHRAAMSAGARVVGTASAAELPGLTAAEVASAGADIVLLTGGTSGGDRAALVAGAGALARLAPGLPVVVAGNEDAYKAAAPLLGDRPVVRFLPNVMPRVGELRVEAVQAAVREIFADHVMGSARFGSGSELAGIVAMPTPAAVLAGVSVLARLGSDFPWLLRPVLVDIGGATTDVHSVLADGAQRSVEGDLGLRESAISLLAAARTAGLAGTLEAQLDQAVRARNEDRAQLPATAQEAGHDRALARFACEIALERHAGTLRFHPGPDGGSLRATGRDLRAATCVIGSGGIFARHDRAGVELTAALQSARERGVLVPAQPVVLTDARHLIWAVGLLETKVPGAGETLARVWVAERGIGQ
jgi:uncharacterized protein (TIGR01319 family)